MTNDSNDTDRLLDRLIDRHGTPFSAELDLDLTRNTPSVLFRWLCAALLMSARISHDAATKAARALSEAGWTTAQHMAAASWEDRVEVLNTSGYARYDESTARMLGETASLLLEDHDGDLRKLRAASDRDPDREREALKACKGIGDVGADIFFRDLQTVWTEHYPLMDDTARNAAQRLHLPDSAEALADRVGRARFVPVVTALVRAELDGIERADLLDLPEREGT